MRWLVPIVFVGNVLSLGCDRQPKTLDECLLRAAQNESGPAIEQAERICREVFSDGDSEERQASGNDTTEVIQTVQTSRIVRPMLGQVTNVVTVVGEKMTLSLRKMVSTSRDGSGGQRCSYG